MSAQEPVTPEITPTKKFYAEMERQRAAISAFEYTTNKPEVLRLLSDPVMAVEATAYLRTVDIIGFRMWVNMKLFGFVDVTQNNLRKMAARFEIPGYGSMSKDDILLALADRRIAMSSKTKEECDDEVRPDDVPERDFVNPQLNNRQFGV